MKSIVKEHGRWIAGIAILIFVAGFFVPVYTSVDQQCDFTGSMRGYVRLPLGLEVNTSYKTSPIESYIAKNYPAELEHRWVTYASADETLCGLSYRGGHGSPNNLYIHNMHLKGFVKEGDPAEIKQFYDLLRSASYGDKATDKAIDAKLRYIMKHFTPRL